MRPTVLSVSYPFAQVRPDTPGGAEQVLLSLDRALTERGWGSVVIAPEGSKVDGTLLPTPPARGRLGPEERSKVRGVYRAAVRFALRHWKIDVAHMHGADFHEYLPDDGVPVLVTLHLPVSWYPEAALRTTRPLTFFNCVSTSQDRLCPEGVRSIGSICNGVRLESFATRVSRRRYAISLGRICPEKGFHLAIEAARIARTPLVMAGGVFPYEEHEEYFRRAVAPSLGPGCRYAGIVGPDRKRRLLSGARCTLVPSLAEETSSLVAMESLACGTPVVAFPSGALPEIVEHGRTGFIVKDTVEMAEAIVASEAISAEQCRASARSFSAVEMAQRYFEAYLRLAAFRRGRGRQ